jgi:acyl dehydratase
VQAGDEFAVRTYRVTRADLVRYAGASGDFNPIHWNERFAVAVGLPSVVAHGMYTMALAGRALTGWLDDPGAVVEFAVRFTKPVPVPDDDAGATVTISGKVRRLIGDGRAEIDLSAVSAGERVLGQARAVVRVPPG